MVLMRIFQLAMFHYRKICRSLSGLLIPPATHTTKPINLHPHGEFSIPCFFWPPRFIRWLVSNYGNLCYVIGIPQLSRTGRAPVSCTAIPIVAACVKAPSHTLPELPKFQCQVFETAGSCQLNPSWAKRTFLDQGVSPQESGRIWFLRLNKRWSCIAGHG